LELALLLLVLPIFAVDDPQSRATVNKVIQEPFPEKEIETSFSDSLFDKRSFNAVTADEDKTMTPSKIRYATRQNAGRILNEVLKDTGMEKEKIDDIFKRMRRKTMMKMMTMRI